MADQWLIYENQTTALDFGAMEVFKLGIAGGNVTIIGHDEPTTRVEVTRVAGAELKISSDNAGLKIEHFKGDRAWNVIGRWFSGAEVDLTVLLPRSTKLRLGNMTANLVVAEMYGGVKSATVSGETTLDQCAGSVDLNSVSGETSIIGHEANDRKAQINTVSGSVAASGRIARLDLNSVSAALSLDLNGPLTKLEINQVSGDVVARLDRQPLRYRVHAKNAAIIDGIQQSRVLENVLFNGELGAKSGVVDLNNAFGSTSILHRDE